MADELGGLDTRVRAVEVWQAGMTVEVDHIKSRLQEAAQALESHAEEDAAARRAVRSENRRFLVGVFMLVLAALVGAYFK